MKELETLRVSPGYHASLNLSEGERESVKWGVLDNPPPRPTYHLSSSPWKVRQSHQGILQPVSLRSGLTSLPQSVIVWELGPIFSPLCLLSLLLAYLFSDSSGLVREATSSATCPL